MKIEKLPSGNFRVRHQVDGRRVSIVLPYKPSKKEASRLIEEKRTGKDKLKLTFDEAAKQYIEGKRNTLSPSTIRGYESLRKTIPDEFKSRQIGDLTSWDVQQYINDLSEKHKPKTVRNHHGFISSVFATFAPDTVLRTNLPQKIKKEIYIPTDEEIERIFEAVKGTQYEIPYRLAARYSLRRSEICALKPEDLEGRTLTINKAMVRDENYKWVIKTTKTESSTRTIELDLPLCKLIRTQNAIYDGDPRDLYEHLQNVLRELNITPFPFHVLRHYYVSTAHAMGFPSEVIRYTTGHKTDYVMKNVYLHEKKEQVAELQRKYADKFNENP